MILLEHNLAILERESIIHVVYVTEDEVQVVRVTRISEGTDALDAQEGSQLCAAPAFHKRSGLLDPRLVSLYKSYGCASHRVTISASSPAGRHPSNRRMLSISSRRAS